MILWLFLRFCKTRFRASHSTKIFWIKISCSLLFCMLLFKQQSSKQSFVFFFGISLTWASVVFTGVSILPFRIISIYHKNHYWYHHCFHYINQSIDLFWFGGWRLIHQLSLSFVKDAARWNNSEVDSLRTFYTNYLSSCTFLFLVGNHGTSLNSFEWKLSDKLFSFLQKFL